MGLRIFTWQMRNADGIPERGVVINPHVVSSKPAPGDPDKDEESEGCLSVPGESFPLKRGERATLTGQDLDGNDLHYDATGWFARMFQHEFDHLNGFLYVDRLDGKWARRAKKAVRSNGWGTPGQTWMPVSTGTPSATTTTPRTTSLPTDARPVLAVVGATGTGKSELGVRLAEALGGEVVNADAMQLYRGMDIGTAKLTQTERRGIPHHQLDVLDVTEEASVAAYQSAARRPRRGPRSRSRADPRRRLRALRQGRARPPHHPADRRRRSGRWEAEATDRGTPAVYAVLRARDPQAAAAIEPGNTRRIVRALEVIELTGQPFSATMPRREFVTPHCWSACVQSERSSTSDLASGWTGCGHTDWSRKWPPLPNGDCARVERRARRSAMPRRSRRSTVHSLPSRPVRRPRRRPDASSVGRSRGSDPTTESSGSTRPILTSA